jgi:pyruvate,orthophosphate dikinase
MSKLGLNVPPAFVLPTSLCAAVNRNEKSAIEALDHGLVEGIRKLEAATGRRFGGERAPLLVSVRSGAARSMPGMLTTILDVGLNAESVRGLIASTGNPRLAWDCYRRFVQIYAEVVENLPAAPFDARLTEMIRTEAVVNESELDCEALERIAHDYQLIFARDARAKIPEAPMEQLHCAARAVYRSWNSPRAVEYRRLNGLDGLSGTAVTVQAMVFGNAGGKSGAGVAFSRNPATGKKELYVDFLFDAQGEDVVSGRRVTSNSDLLARRLSDVAKELSEGAGRLETQFRDVQDIEFTVEEGRLFFLQTRSAKRTPRAALRILVDLVHEGLIDARTALERVSEIDLERTRVLRFEDKAAPVARAISASPGAATGRVAFDSAQAKMFSAAKEPVILVRHDTSTEDVAGFAVADGILTAVGGRTAHAAVVARQLGKVCLVGCRDLKLQEDGRGGEIAGNRLGEGDWLSLDGETGEISLGRRTFAAELPEELAEIDAWRRQAANQSLTA